MMKRFVAIYIALLLILCLTPAMAAADMTLTGKFGGETLSNYAVLFVSENPGDVFVEVQNVTDPLETLAIYYKWDNNNFELCSSGTKEANIQIPNYYPGTLHELSLKAVSQNSESTLSVYALVMPLTPSTSFPVLIPDQEIALLVPSDYTFTFVLSTDLPAGIYDTFWAWDEEPEIQSSYDEIISIPIPERFEVGSTHKLYVQTRAFDQNPSEMYEYTIVISE